MSRPSLHDDLLARPNQSQRAFRAYDGSRALFIVHGTDEQRALQAAMELCLDDGIGYLEKLHGCELVRRSHPSRAVRRRPTMGQHPWAPQIASLRARTSSRSTLPSRREGGSMLERADNAP
jgi:hypothetical protein